MSPTPNFPSSISRSSQKKLNAESKSREDENSPWVQIDGVMEFALGSGSGCDAEFL